MNINKSIPFYLFVIAVFLFITGPSLFSDGMFTDGLLYATISRNLSNGLGSFWYLHFTDTLYPSFHEHPPLSFGIQSIFFIIFGDNIYVERFYSLLTYIITGIIIILIWNKISNNKFKSIAWLPLFFWITIPLVSWGCANNMLENTMMIFVSLSVLFIINSLEHNRFLYLILSGIMLFLGFLTKGFVALFPLSLLFWIWIINKKISFKRFLIDTFILVIAMLVPLLLIYLFDYEGIKSLVLYFNRQVVGSLKNIQTVDNRFYILWRLFSELIPALIILFVSFVFIKKKKLDFRKMKKFSKWIITFLALGLSGVIPIMISMKQSGFYILATFPFFSIALALIIAPFVSLFVSKIKFYQKAFRIFKTISYLLFLISILICLFQINRVGRDKDKIHDIYTIINKVPHNTIISVKPEMWADWSIDGYFARYANISLDPNKKIRHRYFLIKKINENNISSVYRKIMLNTKIYDLYIIDKKITNDKN